MRALLLTNLFPSTDDPTRGLFNLSRFLALSRFCEVRVVVPVPWWRRLTRARTWFQTPMERDTGLEATLPTCWVLPRLAPTFTVGAWSASLRGHVQRLLREYAFDVMVGAFAYPDGVVAARLAQEVGRPVVSVILGSDMNVLARDPALRPQIQWALGLSQRVIAVSHDLGKRAVELGVSPERIVVQHNGVDGERFALRSRQAARARLGFSQTNFIVCYVGNLVAEKGLDVLIEAMGRLRGDSTRETELIVVGRGPLEPQLRRRCSALRLDGRVRFLGPRQHGEVPELLSACDLLCLPSRREGCPNVVLEALASGRPVVASRVGGVPELIHTENGILVAPENVEALAAGLGEAMSRNWDPARLRQSVECLSWHEFGRRFHETLAVAIQEWNVTTPV